MSIDPRYKTEMCTNFLKFGKCPYEDRCEFAHGDHELRLSPREHDPRYKTTLCNHFWGTGRTCRFGKRCMFIHDETEEDLQELRCRIAARLHLWPETPAHESGADDAAASPEPSDEGEDDNDDDTPPPPPPPMVRSSSLEETAANMCDMESHLSHLLLRC